MFEPSSSLDVSGTENRSTVVGEACNGHPQPDLPSGCYKSPSNDPGCSASQSGVSRLAERDAALHAIAEWAVARRGSSTQHEYLTTLEISGWLGISPNVLHGALDLLHNKRVDEQNKLQLVVSKIKRCNYNHALGADAGRSTRWMWCVHCTRGMQPEEVKHLRQQCALESHKLRLCSHASAIETNVPASLRDGQPPICQVIDWEKHEAATDFSDFRISMTHSARKNAVLGALPACVRFSVAAASDKVFTWGQHASRLFLGECGAGRTVQNASEAFAVEVLGRIFGLTDRYVLLAGESELGQEVDFGCSFGAHKAVGVDVTRAVGRFDCNTRTFEVPQSPEVKQLLEKKLFKAHRVACRRGWVGALFVWVGEEDVADMVAQLYEDAAERERVMIFVACADAGAFRIMQTKASDFGTL